MIKGLLERLRCPACKGTLSIEARRVQEDDVRFGHLNCQCSIYPIVAGILVLRHDALTSLAYQQVQNGRYRAATALLLNRPRKKFPLREIIGNLSRHVESLPSPLRRYISTCSRLESFVYSTEASSFEAAISEVTNEYFGYYLLYRPFEQSFWNLHAFLPFIRDHDGPILDFGGGWGHSSHLLHRVTEREVYNLEINFRSLYFQQQFMSDRLGGIVIEPGMDLPFSQNTFGTILDLDGFHYVENKYGIASEYERTTHKDGSILLLHTHNRIFTKRGFPLSPSAYENCFAWNVTIIPEEDFLAGFLDSSVEISNLPNPRDVSQDLNIIISQRPVDDLTVETVGHPFETGVGDVIVNPLYESTEHPDHWHLHRTPLEEKFETEFAFSIKHTDSEYRIWEDQEIPSELLYKGILVPLPTTYAPSLVFET